MTRDYLEEELGLVRREDASGDYFYSYGEDGFFVKSNLCLNKYIFVPTADFTVAGGGSTVLIERKELFEKLYR